MNERVIVPSGGIRLSSLAEPRIVEVLKPAQGHAVTLELDGRRATTLDFSGIADEKLKLVHIGAKLIVEFDNQATVTAEPFFDFSGKPFPYIEVEFSAGQGIHADQYSALLTETAGQASQSDSDAIPSSGANFMSPAIDALPDGRRPLDLLGPEAHKAPFAVGSDGGDGTASHAQLFSAPVPTITGTAPSVTIPSPGGAATLVFEGGLPARTIGGIAEPPGSHAGNAGFPTTTKPGTINFSSPDSVQSVSLGGHVLTSTPQTFTDATGSLTASFTFDTTVHRGTISYTWPQSESTRVVYSDDSYANCRERFP